MQAATDEYIERNEERFVEATALLLRGRDDLCTDDSAASASLSLGKGS